MSWRRRIEGGRASAGSIVPRGLDHMQQHTGQHVLSQAFWELLKGETLSFHMGADVSTLEIGLKTISDADCDRVEDRANAVVWEDRPVKTYFVPEERIGEVPLRRPPKKQGLLRVVEVDGFDYSACGGTHVRRTGEIGLIRVGGTEKIRGNLRFEFLCGGRALRDYRAKDRSARKLAAAFSCPAADVAGPVEKLSAEGKALKKRARRLEERLAAFESREIIRSAAGRVIAGVLEDKTPEEARFLALAIVKGGPFAVAYGAVGESQAHVSSPGRRPSSPTSGKSSPSSPRSSPSRAGEAPRSSNWSWRIGPGSGTPSTPPRRGCGTTREARPGRRQLQHGHDHPRPAHTAARGDHPGRGVHDGGRGQGSESSRGRGPGRRACDTSSPGSATTSSASGRWPALGPTASTRVSFSGPPARPRASP